MALKSKLEHQRLLWLSSNIQVKARRSTLSHSNIHDGKKTAHILKCSGKNQSPKWTTRPYGSESDSANVHWSQDFSSSANGNSKQKSLGENSSSKCSSWKSRRNRFLTCEEGSWSPRDFVFISQELKCWFKRLNATGIAMVGNWSWQTGGRVQFFLKRISFRTRKI